MSASTGRDPMAPAAPLIAVMGGTFDPVHVGHLRAAWEASFALNAVVRMMPANVPPHRPQPRATATQRLDMLKLAIGGKPELQVDARELRRSGPSYSVDTLLELRGELAPAQPLALIVGADAFAGLPTWHRWRELFALAHIVVLSRPGAAAPADWPEALREQVETRRCDDAVDLRDSAGGRVFVLPITPLAISSTRVRENFAHGDVPHWLVPDEVLAYIERHGLYRSV